MKVAANRAHFERVGKDFLSYDPLTGQFTYLLPAPRFFAEPRHHRIWAGGMAGKVAGGSTKHGYIILAIQKRRVLAHHYAFYLLHGRWPTGQIDHINGRPTDNRATNLREVDASGNRMNQCQRTDNRSGVTGVHFDERKRRWVAAICARGARRYLGAYSSRDEAVSARLRGQEGLGFGPNHGASR